MRRYECVAIIDSDISEEKLEVILDKVSSEVDSAKGFLVKVDEWGEKKLAYEIKRMSRGLYICFDFCSSPDFITRIENYFKINDNVLKYMTILLEKNVDLEKIKEEKKKKEEIELENQGEKKISEDLVSAEVEVEESENLSEINT